MCVHVCVRAYVMCARMCVRLCVLGVGGHQVLCRTERRLVGVPHHGPEIVHSKLVHVRLEAAGASKRVGSTEEAFPPCACARVCVCTCVCVCHAPVVDEAEVLFLGVCVVVKLVPRA